MAVKFKPYYLVKAHSLTHKKLVTQYMMNEQGNKNRLYKQDVARKRAVEYANSLNESKYLGAKDWQPKVYLISQHGQTLLGS